MFLSSAQPRCSATVLFLWRRAFKCMKKLPKTMAKPPENHLRGALEGPWDPIGFSKLHENIQGSEHAGVVPSQQWMREAEIKHGRVAMLAFTGALVQSYGMHFDGKLNGMFYEKGVNPFEATPSAFATNPMGMAQILLFIGLTEGYTFPEGAWSGDMKREPGDLGYRVMRSADVMEEQQIKELKNGRAAMLGIMAFSAAHFIPGSVPFFFNA